MRSMNSPKRRVKKLSIGPVILILTPLPLFNARIRVGREAKRVSPYSGAIARDENIVHS